jgi:hypothetical protein
MNSDSSMTIFFVLSSTSPLNTCFVRQWDLSNCRRPTILQTILSVWNPLCLNAIDQNY